MKVTELNVLKAAEAVNNKEITAGRLTESILEQCRSLDHGLHAYAFLSADQALEQAEAVDKKINGGFNLPLAGVALAMGDNYAYRNMPCTFGSPAFTDYYPPFSAAAAEKLAGAGAVVIGKSAVCDFGLGVAGLDQKPVLNPLNFDELAVNSGACAVASGQSLLALESDSSGTARQGAARCGVFGLRPTPGRVSRYGLSLCSGSFDYPALIAADLTGLGIAFQAATGYDERDVLTAINLEPPAKPVYVTEPAKIKLGFAPGLCKHLEPGMAQLYNRFYKHCEEEGFQSIELNLDFLPESLRAFYIVAYAEASSTLARFDGIRYGKAVEAADLEDLYLKSRTVTFGAETCRRSVFGTYLLSKGHFDDYYCKALSIKEYNRNKYCELLSECDLLVLPLYPSSSAPVAAEPDFIKSYEEDLFTAPVSMAGMPSISLPGGIQLVGAPFGDEKLLALGELLMQGFNKPAAVDKGEVK